MTGPVRRPVRMCARCERTTEDPVLVHEVHAASGPGFNVYACPACADHYPPVTDVLDVLDTVPRVAAFPPCSCPACRRPGRSG